MNECKFTKLYAEIQDTGPFTAPSIPVNYSSIDPSLYASPGTFIIFNGAIYFQTSRPTTPEKYFKEKCSTPLYFVGEKDYDWKRDKRERWEANLIPQIDRAHGPYSIGGVFDT